MGKLKFKKSIIEQDVEKLLNGEEAMKIVAQESNIMDALEQVVNTKIKSRTRKDLIKCIAILESTKSSLVSEILDGQFN